MRRTKKATIEAMTVALNAAHGDPKKVERIIADLTEELEDDD